MFPRRFNLRTFKWRNDDGSIGIRMAKEEGAITIVQDPKEAKFPTMPSSVLKNNADSIILKLDEMALYLHNLI